LIQINQQQLELLSTHDYNVRLNTSAIGHKRTLRAILLMSALPPKADIAERHRDVRFVPKAD